MKIVNIAVSRHEHRCVMPVLKKTALPGITPNHVVTNNQWSLRKRKLQAERFSVQHNRQQATGNRQQATGNRQQATGNRQQATGNRQQAIIHIF